MLSFLMTTALDIPAETASRDALFGSLRPVVRSVVACVLRERHDHPDVEDCTNEALRRAFESEKSARGPLRPWVLGIARHVALDTVRARQKSRARNVDVQVQDDASSTTAIVELLADPAAGAEEQIERAERAHRVRRVLATLPEGPRRALELFHLEERSYQEIARQLGVPLGTVATWVTRGRKAVAEELEDELDRAKGKAAVEETS
jgi:RNA polymerase sigma factor (sigma-70 family)